MMRIRDDMDSFDNIYFLEGHCNVVGVYIDVCTSKFIRVSIFIFAPKCVFAVGIH